MDNSKSRKSDAAATRKRRSSILKSQRAPRTPLSELEFNVATPPDPAKSRRVSFSRRTGVAEFEINEATTAWKNVYEEHNKSLETSGNESGGARPRRVAHLGARQTDLFQDAEAELHDADDAPPRATVDLSALTGHATGQLFPPEPPAARDLTDRLDVDFSAVAPLTDGLDAADDLDAAADDLDAMADELGARRFDVSELDVDFNATHITLAADDSDMSITDSIRSPRVAAPERKTADWTADKENIAVNPYVAPPQADNFAVECDDILVFDGKKCKFQSNLDLDEPEPGKASGRTIVHDAAEDRDEQNTIYFDDVADMTVTRAVPVNIISPILIACDDEQPQPKTEKRKTMHFDDLADISVKRPLPANIIQPELERRTIVDGNDEHVLGTEAIQSHCTEGSDTENDDMSMTGVVPANVMANDDGANLADPGNTGRRKTIVYGNDDGNMSMTGVVPTRIMVDKDGANKAETVNTERRKTIAYGNDDGNMSMTGVVPARIIVDKDGANKAETVNTERRKTIVYGNDDGNMSMTGVVPARIIVDKDGASKAETVNTERRKTIVYGNDDGNMSMTGVVPPRIIVDKDGANKAETVNTERRKTIVYGNDDGNMSMTGVVPARIMVDKDGANKAETVSTERRKTIIYGNDDGDISMTGVVPANIMVNKDEINEAQTVNTSSRKTIVYGNDDGNISVTGVVPANIMNNKDEINPAQTVNTDRRKTIVYGNDDGNMSVTGVVPANIIINKGEINQTPTVNTERRKTIVYGNDDGNMSITGIFPANIMMNKDEINKTQTINTERSKTIVYGNYDGNISMTGVVPANIMVENDRATLAKPATTDRRKTAVDETEDGDVSMTGVFAPNIMDGSDIAKPTEPANRRATVVYDNDECMTGVVASSTMLDKDVAKLPQTPNTDRSKSVAIVNDLDISITGVEPANIIVEENDKAELTKPTTDRSRTMVYADENGDVSMTGVVPANIMDDKDIVNETQPPHTDRRKTIVYGNEDGDVSITGVVPAHLAEKEGLEINEPNDDRSRTTVYEDGDVSMTEPVPRETGARIHTQNELDYEVKDDQVNSTFHRSLSNVLVYETSLHGPEGSKTHDASPRGNTTQDRTPATEETESRESPSDQAVNAAPNSPVCGTSPKHASVHDSGNLSPDGAPVGAQSRSLASTSMLEAMSHILGADRTSILEPLSRSSEPDSRGEIERSSILDELSRTLAANYSSVADRSRNAAPYTSVLDELSRSLGLERTLALEVLSRSLAADRASLVAALSAKTAARSPPAAVLDALLDMSAMDDEPLEAPAELSRGPASTAIHAAVDDSTPASRESYIIIKDDDEPENVAKEEPSDEREEILPLEDKRSLEDDKEIVRLTETETQIHEQKSPEKKHMETETSDMEEEEDKNHWLSTRSAATQADDTRALLDALSDLTDTRRSGDFARERASRRSAGAERRSLAPDRRSMVRSREDLLKDISMAQAIIRSELAAAEAEPGSPLREVVKTLRFDDDSPRESPLRKPAHASPSPRRASAVIPPYLQHVNEEVKELMEDLIKPTADMSPFCDRAPLRHSQIQADLIPSSQVDLASMESVPSPHPACLTHTYPPEFPSDASDEAIVESPARSRVLTPRRSPVGSRVLSPRNPAAPILIFDHENPLNNVLLPAAEGVTHKYAPRMSASVSSVSASVSLRQHATQTQTTTATQMETDARVGDVGSPELDRTTTQDRGVPGDEAPAWEPPRVTEVNMALVGCSELTLVDDALTFSPHPRARSPACSPPRVSFRPARSPSRSPRSPPAPSPPRSPRSPLVQAPPPPDARKRSHRPADPSIEPVTPKPAIKMQRRSGSPPGRRSRSPSPGARDNECGGAVTVQQLLSEFSLIDVKTESATSLPGDGLAERDLPAGANVVAKIDMLPFMGSSECEWETRSHSTWSFLLLRGRLRLVLRPAHRHDSARGAVRADTPVAPAGIHHVRPDQERSDALASLCVCLTVGALRRCVAATARCGAVPALLRRCVRVARVARRWARALSYARTALAFSLQDDGLLTLKVANIPLRSVWEVKLRIELIEEEWAWPRATDVAVTPVVATWSPSDEEVARLLAPLPRDWGHVPRTVWKIFKHLKQKKPEDDLLLGA